MTAMRTVARPMLGATFVVLAMDAFRTPEPRARMAAPVIEMLKQAIPLAPRDPVTLVRANAAVQVVSGGLLSVGIVPRLAALALAASLVPTTLAGHRFWEIDDPAQRRQQRTHFLKNTAMLGGLLLAASD